MIFVFEKKISYHDLCSWYGNFYSKRELDAAGRSNHLLDFHKCWDGKLFQCMLYCMEKIPLMSSNANYCIRMIRGCKICDLAQKIPLFSFFISMYFKVKNCSTLVPFSGPFSTSPLVSWVKRWYSEKKSNRCKKPHSNRPNPNLSGTLPLATVQVSTSGGIGWLLPLVNSRVYFFWHIKWELIFHVLHEILYKTYVSIHQSKALVT